MHERLRRGDKETRRRARDAAIDRRALEILQRRGCDWIEAWARAVAEQNLVDEREQLEDSPAAQRRIRRARLVPGRVTLSDQIGIARRPTSKLVAPGRRALSAALPAVRSADAAASALDPWAPAIGDGVVFRDGQPLVPPAVRGASAPVTGATSRAKVRRPTPSTDAVAVHRQASGAPTAADDVVAERLRAAQEHSGARCPRNSAPSSPVRSASISTR